MMNSSNNGGMPFSVSDILQPLDMDGSNSYKRSIEMAQALAAASSSSSVYSSQRPTNSVTPGNIGPNNYYGVASTNSSFPTNNQYYDYASSFSNSSSVNGQYPSNSCWYGPAASKKR